MVTDEQARTAADRLISNLGKQSDSRRRLTEIAGDRDQLVDWAIQELSRRTPPDDGPITAEWLESLSNWRRTENYVWTHAAGGEVWYHVVRSRVGFGMNHLRHITTRAQLLALLAALKGGVS